MQPNIIELSDVGYGYDDRMLLSGVSLSLDAGGFYFLTGPSGAGKTTFLRMCYLELVPSIGALSLFGQPTADIGRDEISRARRRIGIIHQDCKFLDHLSILENITLPLVVAGRDLETENDNIKQLMKWVRLEERADALPPELSGGERQRAALARAVVMSPDLILADEPTGNVDWEMSERLLSLLVELNKMGKTVLLATHDLPLIRSARARVESARVLRLSAGTVTVAGGEL